MIYENIKRMCSMRGTNISELERKLGFPRSSICKWDLHSPRLDKVILVAEALGVSIDDLVAENK